MTHAVAIIGLVGLIASTLVAVAKGYSQKSLERERG